MAPQDERSPASGPARNRTPPRGCGAAGHGSPAGGPSGANAATVARPELAARGWTRAFGLHTRLHRLPGLHRILRRAAD